MNFDYKENYKKQLEEGQKFQDHCAYWLQKILNIGIVNFQTKEYQYKFGENMQGIEFKLDKVFKTTGNLWIEIAERNNPDNSYSDSGILRNDNTWLYCIGNYDILYIFQTNILIGMCRSGRYPIIENNVMTSKGFLIPEGDADKYGKKIEIKQTQGGESE